MSLERNYLKFVYGFWAKIYDEWIDKWFAFDRQEVVDALKLQPGSRVIEIGVGTGLNLPHYPADVTVVGVDFSLAMVQKAKAKPSHANVTLMVNDAEGINLPDNYFTHALATFVLRVAVSPQDLLEEVARVVLPKGRFVVVDQFQPWRWPVSYLKRALGWGNDFLLEDVLKKTPWKIVEQTNIASMKNTTIIVLENNKDA